MTEIPRKYIVDENNRRIAVQLDIATFTEIEELLENYGLVRLMGEGTDSETLSMGEAKSFYHTLDEAK